MFFYHRATEVPKLYLCFPDLPSLADDRWQPGLPRFGQFSQGQLQTLRQRSHESLRHGYYTSKWL